MPAELTQEVENEKDVDPKTYQQDRYHAMIFEATNLIADSSVADLHHRLKTLGVV